jgi:hypothetical protein
MTRQAEYGVTDFQKLQADGDTRDCFSENPHKTARTFVDFLDHTLQPLECESIPSNPQEFHDVLTRTARNLIITDYTGRIASHEQYIVIEKTRIVELDAKFQRDLEVLRKNQQKPKVTIPVAAPAENASGPVQKTKTREERIHDRVMESKIISDRLGFHVHPAYPFKEIPKEEQKQPEKKEHTEEKKQEEIQLEENKKKITTDMNLQSDQIHALHNQIDPIISLSSECDTLVRSKTTMNSLKYIVASGKLREALNKISPLNTQTIDTLQEIAVVLLAHHVVYGATKQQKNELMTIMHWSNPYNSDHDNTGLIRNFENYCRKHLDEVKETLRWWVIMESDHAPLSYQESVLPLN